jgi:hypothetical protein
MSNTLNEQYIDETFPGLLHASGAELPLNGKKDIYDGNGNKTALSLGREENGAGITGNFEVSGTLTNKSVNYPITSPNVNDLVAAGASNPLDLRFVSLTDLLTALGATIADGIYTNPTLTFKNNVLIGVSSNSIDLGGGGMQVFTSSGLFTVPSGIYKVKFIVTGGGGYICSGDPRPGGAGGTVIGYLAVTPGQNLQVIVGAGGTEINRAGGSSSIANSNGTVASANGGNTTVIAGGLYGGGTSGVGSDPNILSYLSIRGGDGGHARIRENDRDSIGAASYWGNAPAYGGGVGGGPGADPANYVTGSGVVVFEW